MVAKWVCWRAAGELMEALLSAGWVGGNVAYTPSVEGAEAP